MATCNNNPYDPADVNTNCSESAGLPLGTDSGKALSCNASAIDAVVNGSQSVKTRTGKTLSSLSQLEQGYTITAVNGGIWASGEQFTAYNQYMVFDGVAYRPKVSTTLPYTVGTSPDPILVEPVPLTEKGFKTPYDFGACGDGVTDDTDAMQAYLDQGGFLSSTPGVFRITRPIIGKGNTTLSWPTSATGTGGFDVNDPNSSTLDSLLDEAAEGAASIYVDPNGWTNPNGESQALVFRETRNKNMPSVTLINFKIATEIDTPAPVGLIRTEGAYDNLSFFNVNAMFGGDSQPVIEITRADVAGFQVCQSINWTGVNAIGSTGGNRTAPTIKLNYCQEGTFTSCKAFGSPFRVDGEGASLQSFNTCWEVDNSRGLVWTGSSAALTQGNGWVFKATERSCQYHLMDGCTYEVLGSDDGQYAAIVFDRTTQFGVGRVTVSAPRIEFPVYYFLVSKTSYNDGSGLVGPFGINAEVSTGEVTLGEGTSNSYISTDQISKVVNNSGNNSNTIYQRANGITPFTGFANDIASVKDNPSLWLGTNSDTALDRYQITWSATESVDFGLVFRNYRAQVAMTHENDGKFSVLNALNAIDATARVTLDPDTGLISQRQNSPTNEFIAGDNDEFNYQIIYSASTASGVLGTNFRHDGSSVMSHEVSGSLALNGPGETALKLKASDGTTKTITVGADGELYINGTKKTGV